MSSPVIENPQQTLVLAAAFARAGNHEKARGMLRQVVQAMPDDERGWLWLAFVAASTEEKRTALRKALQLRPNDERVKQAFMQLLDTQHVRQAAKRGVFISYSPSDDLFAIELADELRAAGIHAWLDVAEIDDEDDWDNRVSAAMQACGVMLVIISPEAMDDENAQKERFRFGEAGKIIIPVLYRHSEYRILNIWHPPVDCRYDPKPGIYSLIKLLSSSQTINA
ncbi:MAG: TIR domain-containing protein [Anaerolineae bacterium]